MYTFIKEKDPLNPYDRSVISHKIALGDTTGNITSIVLLKEFSYFLKSCGYDFKDIVIKFNNRDKISINDYIDED
jgi:hypothetical protein